MSAKQPAPGPGNRPDSDDPRPRSAVSAGTGIAGLAGLAAWLVIARQFGLSGSWSALLNLAACGVPMVLWSLLVDKVHRNPDTGIDWGLKRAGRDTRDVSMVKLAGLWGTWGAIAIFYSLGRWYWQGGYLFAMELFEAAALLLLAGSVPYIFWIDRHLVDPKDGAWHFGAWLVGEPGWDAEEIRNHARSWAVKGFFIAFMVSIVPGGYHQVVSTPTAAILAGPVALASWLITLMFAVDVAFATVGYVLTMKPLDAHIRTANPSTQGWVAALICYPPFILMGPDGVLNYHTANLGDQSWTYWFAGSPAMLYIWGGALVLLTALYAWATVAFGLRFSNLTHRGILTHGPYAWSKHPAYLAKNAFWWMATLPFLTAPASLVDAFRNTATLALVSLVYFWRARTEEAHLGTDPAYRAYAAWMERHGPVPRLIRHITGRAAALPSPDRRG